jgi:putative tryptophan/tyrosine transport system substrate-binding protein
MSDADLPEYGALTGELRRLGQAQGQTLAIQKWSTAGTSEGNFDAIAREIVESRPDVIFAVGSRLVLALKGATTTIPIVFSAALPLELGIVRSIARPEANLTGMALDAGPEITGKRMQLLRDAKPGVTTLGYLGTPQTWDAAAGAQVRAAAEQLGLTVAPVLISPVTADSIRDGLKTLIAWNDVALMVNTSADFEPHATLIADIALASRWPGVTQARLFPASGLLMSYGPAALVQFRHAAGYIDRIAKGAKPGDLPVQQPTEFDFVVNLKTAKALGITMPEPLMVFATEVIE